MRKRMHTETMEMSRWRNLATLHSRPGFQKWWRTGGPTQPDMIRNPQPLHGTTHQMRDKSEDCTYEHSVKRGQYM
eukprot:3299686-Amphidinium_carterae.1